MPGYLVTTVGHIYQASAVLIAPETFPATKKFPSDTFKVHVKFTDEDGEVTEDDLELKIEAAPVVLIPGMFDNAEKTFGFYKNTGVYRGLLDNNFDKSCIYLWDYDASQGPNELLADDNNELFSELTKIFNEYAQRGIVCTKADIVAHGLGGLMARKYLHEERKDSEDGNNWSVRSYKQGMVRRLITVATPHRGTPWADDIDKRRFITLMYNGLLNSPFNEDHPRLENVLKPFTLLINTVFPSPQLFNNAYFFNGSAWNELKMTQPRNYGMPAGVPMHAIYGNIRVEGGLKDYWTIFTKVVDEITGKNIDIFDLPSMARSGLDWLMSEIAKKLMSNVETAAKYATPIKMLKFAGRFMGAISIIYDVPSYMRIATDVIATVLFGSEANDLIVSASSATAGILPSTVYHNEGFDNLNKNNDRYSHWSICQQYEVGEKIASLLKGTKDEFTVLNSEIIEETGRMAQNLYAASPSDIEEDDEFEIIKTLKLKVSPKIFPLLEDKSQNVRITLTSVNPVYSDVYCTFGNDEDCRFFKLPASDETQKIFEVELKAGDIFVDMDAGAIEMLCMSCISNDGGISGMYTSNAVNIGWLTDAISDDEEIEDDNIPPSILTDTLPNAITGQSYSFQFNASGTSPIKPAFSLLQ